MCRFSAAGICFGQRPAPLTAPQGLAPVAGTFLMLHSPKCTPAVGGAGCFLGQGFPGTQVGLCMQDLQLELL